MLEADTTGSIFSYALGFYVVVSYVIVLVYIRHCLKDVFVYDSDVPLLFAAWGLSPVSLVFLLLYWLVYLPGLWLLGITKSARERKVRPEW